MSKIVDVTDHALVRYMERIARIDLSPIREEVVRLVQSAVNLGAPNYSIDGHTFILQGPRVITVVEARSGSKMRRNGVRRRGHSVRAPK